MRAAAFLALIVCGTACAVAQAAPPTPLMQRPVARDVVSEDALRHQMKGVRPMKALLAAGGPNVLEILPLERRPQFRNTLLERSILLFDGEFYTCIPVGSILHLPASLRDRVVTKPTGQFLLWPAFLKRNASWLATQEVPLAMARGDAQIAESVLSRLTAEKRAIVAVHRDGPITILEPTPPVAPTHK